MSYEEKDGDFVLFKAKIRKSEKSPHYKGTILKGGVKHDFLMWEKTSKNGVSYYSGKIGDVAQPPQSNAKPQMEQQRQAQSNNMDDEIPW
jgi:type IV secretory pathway TrbL component